MSTEFALVRHATCALTASTLLGRSIDAPLDAHGLQQAEALAQRLGNAGAALLQSSPRLRAQQTAAPLAAHLGLAVINAAPLDEVDFGSWAGRSFAELQREPSWRRWNEQRSSARTPLGESMQDIQQRTVEHLAALAATFTNAKLILITHAEIIRAALLYYLHWDCEAYREIEIGPASITTLRMVGGRTQVLRINEVVS